MLFEFVEINNGDKIVWRFKCTVNISSILHSIFILDQVLSCCQAVSAKIWTLVSQNAAQFVSWFLVTYSQNYFCLWWHPFLEKQSADHICDQTKFCLVELATENLFTWKVFVSDIKMMSVGSKKCRWRSLFTLFMFVKLVIYFSLFTTPIFQSKVWW